MRYKDARKKLRRKGLNRKLASTFTALTKNVQSFLEQSVITISISILFLLSMHALELFINIQKEYCNNDTYTKQSRDPA